MKRQNRVAFFNILSTLLLRGISIFTAPLFSRLLGDSGYGVMAIYTIWTSAIAIAFPLQTQGTLVNGKVEYPEQEQKQYQSSVMSLSILVFSVCSILVLTFVKPISGLLKLEPFLICMMLIQAFGTFCVDFLSTKFTYEFKAGRNMLISLGVTLITLILSVLFVLQLPYETRYYGRIVAIVTTYALFGIPAAVYILSIGKTFFSQKYWKFSLYLALPAVFYNLSDLVLGQSDRVMLQQMMSDAMVGQYSLALNFGNIMFTIFAALNNTWCPFFFEDMKQGNKDKLHAQAKNYLELYTVLSVGFILLATEVYHVFAAREFWSGTRLIPIFVSSFFINFLCTFPVNYEYYHKKIRVVAVVTISSSLINIGLNYLWIQQFGMFGAAMATCVSHGLQLSMHYVYARYIIKGEYPFPVKLWYRYGLVYILVVVLVYLTPDAWLLRWLIGAMIGLWELWRIKKRKVLL